ncbi:MAG: CopD family protein [Chloroflexi bacterium]|nr:CopD family protein [Chloroflexota bacterium]
MAMVLVPVTRSVGEPPGSGARILGSAARRFRVVAWGALIAIVGTGIWILLERGVYPMDLVRGKGWFYQTLRVKVVLVALVLALSVIHDFVLGPRLTRGLESLRGASRGEEAILRQRRVVSWMARINLLLALAILALGVMLVRGASF